MVCLLNFGPFRPKVKQILFQRNPIYFCDYYLSKAGVVGRLDATIRRSIAYQAMCSAVKIVTPSIAMSDMVRKSYPALPPEKFVVIRHGFDAASFTVTGPAGAWPAPPRLPNEIRLLYASHAALHKGIDVAIDTVAELVQGGINARLFLTMSPEDWPSGMKGVVNRIASLGLKEHVILTGRIEQEVMPSLYQHFDIFLFPSLCESFGFTMLEALSAGLPVVAADTPINREILGAAALYYQPLDATAAAAQVLSVIKQDKLRSHLKSQARRRIDDGDWGWERYGREFLCLIESLSVQSHLP
jgi:glycosyltransferase involved in cell wall biosynthesis